MEYGKTTGGKMLVGNQGKYCEGKGREEKA
jgi:hypothetical protein